MQCTDVREANNTLLAGKIAALGKATQHKLLDLGKAATEAGVDLQPPLNSIRKGALWSVLVLWISWSGLNAFLVLPAGLQWASFASWCGGRRTAGPGARQSNGCSS